MASALRSNSNVTFQCAFHVVWCPKYRRRVLGGRVETRLKEVVCEVVTDKAAWLVEMEVRADHFAPAGGGRPAVRGAPAGQGHQGGSSGVLREEFSHLKSRLPTLWTNSYFVATVGGAPLEQIKTYVENQKNR